MTLGRMTPMQRSEYAGPVALRAMQSLAVRAFPIAGWRHIGDLAWEGACYEQGDDCPTAVWTDGDRTLAWGWLESGGDLMFQVDPDRPELADEVLAWAERAAGDWSGVKLSATIAESEPHLAAALEGRGYLPAVDGPFFVGLGRGLGDLPELPALPEGYTIRLQRDAADVAGRAAVHRAVWNSTRMTTDRHARMRESWPYRPEFDPIVVSPAGEVVAYCQGWYDEANGIGLFEPVGTHPEHRRLGLSRAVGAVVLHAFAAAGGRRAVVCPRGDADYPIPKLVYESLGFTAYTRSHTYTR
jgi:GNAT superfamily N-acetyltransferase